jgi:hypothetical protein
LISQGHEINICVLARQLPMGCTRAMESYSYAAEQSQNYLVILSGVDNALCFFDYVSGRR